MSEDDVEIKYARLLDPLTPKDIEKHEKMGKQMIVELFKTVEDKGCRNLITAFMNQYLHPFMRMTGSTTHHHSYIGGLKDHSMDVFRKAIVLGKEHNSHNNGLILNNTPVNLSVIGTGGFLHDIGKLWMYQDAQPLKRPKGGRPKKAFIRTDEAKVMGHFGEAIWMLRDMITPEMGLSIQDERAIFHIIASHHGEVRSSYGDGSSMVNPCTNEAWIVHSADLLSAKLR